MTAHADAGPYYRKAAILLVLFLLIGLVGVHFGDRSLMEDAGVARSTLPAEQQSPQDSSMLRGSAPDTALNAARYYSSPTAAVNGQHVGGHPSATSDARGVRRLRRRTAAADGWVGLIP